MKIQFLLLFSILSLGYSSNSRGETSLVINELMAQNDGFIQDSHGDYEDWIEIYNYGDYPINIGGMYLTDDLTAPAKWRIPDSNAAATTIPSHGHLLIWADNETNDGILHASFRLNISGEQIGLYDAYGILIDSVVFGPQEVNYSYGRLPDGA